MIDLILLKSHAGGGVASHELYPTKPENNDAQSPIASNQRGFGRQARHRAPYGERLHASWHTLRREPAPWRIHNRLLLHRRDERYRVEAQASERPDNDVCACDGAVRASVVIAGGGCSL